MKKILVIVGILISVILFVAIGYVYNNYNFDKPLLKQIKRAGLIEKQIKLDDGTLLNYAEGHKNGPPLLLIHGQAAAWQIYGKVIKELSNHYHIYAIDCHGHGKSSRTPKKYSAKLMGKDFIWFIENVIGKPVIVSGHSSGGLLAAWLAANSPKNVLGVVLEDPPFFSSEANRCEKTFAWLDLFVPCHNFLKQNETNDFTLYYLENCYWINLFGEGKEGIIKSAKSYREKHHDQRLVIFYLPPSINRSFYFMDKYDPQFGNAFYDCSWMEDFNHEETMLKISCPSVLIHTKWSYDEKGVLMAGMNGEDAKKAHSLIKNNILINIDLGHSVAYENPKKFIEIMLDFLNKIKE
ncbi:MAG TPA: alpha/beta hydrolase [Bacteroidales bacterium]|nr:alpha/beta hydrolase [Bacteroidales bacterium]